MDSPWIRSHCHACDGGIDTGQTIYLDTDGGLYCSFYCLNAQPNPGVGGRVQERATDYLIEPGLCADCAHELNLPPNVHVGGFVCGHCRHFHPLTMADAIKLVWTGSDPQAAGLSECPECDGFGHSLIPGNDDSCAVCNGSGLVAMSLADRVSWTHSQLMTTCGEAAEIFQAAHREESGE